MLLGSAFDLQNLMFTALTLMPQKGLAFHTVVLQSFLIDKLPRLPSCMLSLKHFLIGFI